MAQILAAHELLNASGHEVIVEMTMAQPDLLPGITKHYRLAVMLNPYPDLIDWLSRGEVQVDQLSDGALRNRRDSSLRGAQGHAKDLEDCRPTATVRSIQDIEPWLELDCLVLLEEWNLRGVAEAFGFAKALEVDLVKHVC